MTCDSCPTGATDAYTFAIGFPVTYPELTGTTALTHDSGCSWISESFNIAAAAWVASTYYFAGDYVTNGGNLYTCTSSGTSASSGGPSGTGTGITDGGAEWDYSTDPDNGDYEWQLTQAGADSTLSLALVSGTDVMNLASRPFTYAAQLPWSCRCISKMILTTAETLMDSTGIDVVICLTPVASTGCCENCWGFTVSGISGPPSSCTGFNGSWVLAYAGDLGDMGGCQWDQAKGDLAVHLSYAKPNAVLRFSGASFPFDYHLTDPHLCDGGEKTFTLSTEAVCSGVPATITIAPVDCGTTTTSSTTPSTTSTTSTTTPSTTGSTTSSTTTETSTTTGTTTGTSSTTETSTTTGTTSTSTSSTTANPCVSLGCEWTWSGSGWSNTNSSLCMVPCAACVTQPGFSGSMPGEKAYTNCEIAI
ncbi:MAG: hypothetical protein U0941_10585 [Planctomycetaceae bacterium]